MCTVQVGRICLPRFGAGSRLPISVAAIWAAVLLALYLFQEYFS